MAARFLSDVILFFSWFFDFLMALDDAISLLDEQSDSTSAYEKVSFSAWCLNDFCMHLAFCLAVIIYHQY